MRRASEMLHVAGMVQVGMRGVGSARRAELEAATAYGSRIVTARDVHTEGVEAVIRHVPEGAKVVITLDCDGLDPSIMPCAPEGPDMLPRLSRWKGVKLVI